MLPNANEIDTKNMKCTWPTPRTQRKLYSTGWRLGLASGITQILALGTAKIYQHVGISNAKFWRRGHCDECIEWQVNFGYQKFCKFLIEILKKHVKLPICLSSIHDQNTIFIQISHIAKSHTHKSIFGSTQTINQSNQCIYCQFNY